MFVLLTVTLHIVDVRLTCLINITYLLTYLQAFIHSSQTGVEHITKSSPISSGWNWQ